MIQESGSVIVMQESGYFQQSGSVMVMQESGSFQQSGSFYSDAGKQIYSSDAASGSIIILT